MLPVFLAFLALAESKAHPPECVIMHQPLPPLAGIDPFLTPAACHSICGTHVFEIAPVPADDPLFVCMCGTHPYLSVDASNCDARCIVPPAMPGMVGMEFPCGGFNGSTFLGGTLFWNRYEFGSVGVSLVPTVTSSTEDWWFLEEGGTTTSATQIIFAHRSSTSQGLSVLPPTPPTLVPPISTTADSIVQPTAAPTFISPGATAGLGPTKTGTSPSVGQSAVISTNALPTTSQVLNQQPSTHTNAPGESGGIPDSPAIPRPSSQAVETSLPPHGVKPPSATTTSTPDQPTPVATSQIPPSLIASLTGGCIVLIVSFLAFDQYRRRRSRSNEEQTSSPLRNRYLEDDGVDPVTAEFCSLQVSQEDEQEQPSVDADSRVPRRKIEKETGLPPLVAIPKNTVDPFASPAVEIVAVAFPESSARSVGSLRSGGRSGGKVNGSFRSTSMSTSAPLARSGGLGLRAPEKFRWGSSSK
ncbi:hypothetical protein HDU98_002309 [Podochytrium sp. JEL0797]|nr:hypothetical protein HDU98_002309 [Podochytrium sp. JEL0797]